MAFFPTLLSDGGPIMPLILLAALAGYVLACERLIVWAFWYWRDRLVRQAPDGHKDGGKDDRKEGGNGDHKDGGSAALIRALEVHSEVNFEAQSASPSNLTPYRAVLSEALAITRRVGLGETLPSAESTAAREAAIHAVIMSHMARVETRISTIGWIGTILPLLGLLGTVSGMITTFQDLAVTSSRQVLSQGLSEALWTTEVGLIGALPLLAVHHMLGRLKSRWLNHLERALALISLLPFSSDGPDAPDATPHRTARSGAKNHEA
jgi:biopolymer transport protein ExbB/TolQ